MEGGTLDVSTYHMYGMVEAIKTHDKAGQIGLDGMMIVIFTEALWGRVSPGQCGGRAGDGLRLRRGREGWRGEQPAPSPQAGH